MAYELDAKDYLILEELKRDGNQTTRQIAKKTLLPITTIHHRIKKLKEEKIIKKYTIEIDHKRINKGLLIYILITVNLETLKEKKKTQYDIAKELRTFEFTQRADIVSGGTDLLAIIRVKDVNEFDKVLLENIQLIEGVSNTQSLMVIHEDD